MCLVFLFFFVDKFVYSECLFLYFPVCCRSLPPCLGLDLAASLCVFLIKKRTTKHNFYVHFVGSSLLCILVWDIKIRGMKGDVCDGVRTERGGKVGKN